MVRSTSPSEDTETNLTRLRKSGWNTSKLPYNRQRDGPILGYIHERSTESTKRMQHWEEISSSARMVGNVHHYMAFLCLAFRSAFEDAELLVAPFPRTRGRISSKSI